MILLNIIRTIVIILLVFVMFLSLLKNKEWLIYK